MKEFVWNALALVVIIIFAVMTLTLVIASYMPCCSQDTSQPIVVSKTVSVPFKTTEAVQCEEEGEVNP